MLKIDVAGLKIDSITKQEFLDSCLNRIKENKKTFVITPYSEFLYNSFQDPKLLEIFNSADFSLADGIGIFWAKKYLDIPLTAKSYWGKILQAAWQIKYSLAAIIFNPSWIKSAFPEKIVGADLIWDLAAMAQENNLSIFLLGGFGNTPKLAAEKLKNVAKMCGRTFLPHEELKVFYSNKNPDDSSLIEEMNSLKPDILLVAYGPIKQEKWIVENLPKLNTKLAIGLGGTLDYLAGSKSQPPSFIRYSGFEWLWRLFTQPKRFSRITNATFGLAWGLWHYKVFESLPLRPNVAIVILNQNNEALVCQRKPTDNKIDIIISAQTLSSLNYWQFPQGGIDAGEDIIQTAHREAQEETGIKNLQFIKISAKTHTYIWNNALRDFWQNKTKRNKGQIQNIVYFKFTGENSEIKVDNKEFINYKWVDIKDLKNTIHPERSGLTNIAVEDLNA